MSNGKIKINELPEAALAKDSDIFILENDATTQKISLGSLINYVKEHEEIADYFVKQSAIDSENGVAPLDGNRKIPSANLPFGTTENTVYDGALGQTLADSYSALNKNLTELEKYLHTTTEDLQKQISNIENNGDGNGNNLSEIESNISKINTSIANINKNTSQLFTITDNLTTSINTIGLLGSEYHPDLIKVGTHTGIRLYLTHMNNGLTLLQLVLNNVTEASLPLNKKTDIYFLPTIMYMANTTIPITFSQNSTNPGSFYNLLLNMEYTTYNNESGTMFSITTTQGTGSRSFNTNFRTIIK